MVKASRPVKLCLHIQHLAFRKFDDPLDIIIVHTIQQIIKSSVMPYAQYQYTKACVTMGSLTFICAMLMLCEPVDDKGLKLVSKGGKGREG